MAAAVASLFASELANEGVAGGTELRGLVFVVITITVTLQGLSAGLVARLLGVRLPPRQGALILGANPLARLVGGVLRDLGRPVILVDSRPEACAAARAAGLEVMHGGGLDYRVLAAAGIDAVAYCIGVTPNEHVNCPFARRLRAEFRGP